MSLKKITLQICSHFLHSVLEMGTVFVLELMSPVFMSHFHSSSKCTSQTSIIVRPQFKVILIQQFLVRFQFFICYNNAVSMYFLILSASSILRPGKKVPPFVLNIEESSKHLNLFIHRFSIFLTIFHIYLSIFYNYLSFFHSYPSIH